MAGVITLWMACRKFIKWRQDISSFSWFKNTLGKLVIDANGIKETWKEHMEKVKLINEEKVWGHETCCNLKQDVAACLSIMDVIRLWNNWNKWWNTKPRNIRSGCRDVESSRWFWYSVADGFVQWSGKRRMWCRPSDWQYSVLLPVFKGKEYPMNCGLYWGIRFLVHTVKVVERVFENWIRHQVHVDMQFDFEFDWRFLLNWMWDDKFRAKDKIRNCFSDSLTWKGLQYSVQGGDLVGHA